jgi:adenosylhomocysteinase
MRSGAILCNAGHFNVEINLEELAALARERYEARHNIEGFVLANGRTVYVLGEGRLVNLAAGDGHPAEIMDMSFAIQARSAEFLAGHRDLAPGVYPVPREIDLSVARTKLETLGIAIDALSAGQRAYLGI